jgi:hypothetical protein
MLRNTSPDPGWAAPSPASAPAPPFGGYFPYASDTEAVGSVDLRALWIASLHLYVKTVFQNKVVLVTHGTLLGNQDWANTPGFFVLLATGWRLPGGEFFGPNLFLATWCSDGKC